MTYYSLAFCIEVKEFQICQHLQNIKKSLILISIGNFINKLNKLNTAWKFQHLPSFLTSSVQFIKDGYKRYIAEQIIFNNVI